MTPPASLPVCEMCGGPAIIHVTNEVGAQRSIRHFCQACASLEESKANRQRRDLNQDAVLIAVGLFVLFLSVFADQLQFGRSDGLGWRQGTGIGVGLILVGVGAALRVLTLMMIGLVFTSLTLAADWFQLGSSPGFGWLQTLGILAGVGCTVSGLALARRRKGLRWLARRSEEA